MLTVYILERSAEEREKLILWLQSMLSEDIPEIEYVPRIDLRPIAFDELKFATTPELVIIGPRLLEEELTWLGKIGKVLPKIPVIACTSPAIESLSHIEQMARLGANDTLSLTATPKEFLKKLVLLAKSKKEERSGNLIVVDSGKGGVGVTTVAAALAELSALAGKRTALVDFDFETQDLSRFLQVRPFVNENLQLILEGARPISKDYVDQCYVQVWEEEQNLFAVAPPAESDILYASDSRVLRRLVSFFEALDEQFDTVIIDTGSSRGSFQKTLYRIADQVVFVLNRDPAALYPSVDRLRKLSDMLPPGSQFTVVDNGGLGGLPRNVLLKEFSRAARITEDDWCKAGIPQCKSGARWPGSGNSFVALTNSQGKDALEKVAARIGILDSETVSGNIFFGLIKQLKDKAKGTLSKQIISNDKSDSTISLTATSTKQLPEGSLDKIVNSSKVVHLSKDKQQALPAPKGDLFNLVAEAKEDSLDNNIQEKIFSEELEAKVESIVKENLKEKQNSYTINKDYQEVTELISKATLQ